MQITKMTDKYMNIINSKDAEFFKYFHKPLASFFSKNLGFRRKKFCRYILNVPYRNDSQLLNDTAVLYGKLSSDLILYLMEA